MRVIAFEAALATSSFPPGAGITEAKNADDLAVLAPAHFYKEYCLKFIPSAL